MKTTTKCWHCHEKTLMVDPSRSNAQYVSSIPSPIFPDHEFREENDDTDLRIFSCVNCGYPNIGEVETRFVGDETGFEHNETYIIRWIPIEPMGKDYDGVPSDIASIAFEAHKCPQIGETEFLFSEAKCLADSIGINLDELALVQKARKMQESKESNND